MWMSGIVSSSSLHNINLLLERKYVYSQLEIQCIKVCFNTLTFHSMLSPFWNNLKFENFLLRLSLLGLWNVTVLVVDMSPLVPT